MRYNLSLFLLILATHVHCWEGDISNEDIILAPPPSKGIDLDIKLMVLIPGAGVSTSYYIGPMTEVQKQTNLRLWIVVPAFGSKYCIESCTTTVTCEPMNHAVNQALAKAVLAGYDGLTNQFFMSGHSLGGTCAATWTQAYGSNGSNIVFGNVIYGSYVTDQDVAGWKVPVMTVGAELDGGLGRPGYLLNSIQSSDKAAKANDGVYSDWQMEQKPVLILQGMDHSDFCPGFRVPGDVYPSDITDTSDSNALIGYVTAHFLHLHSNQSTARKAVAKSYLREQSKWAREQLLKPMTDAIAQLQGSVDGAQAPWCERAQPELVGFQNEDDRQRLTVNATYREVMEDFVTSLVSYNTTDSGSTFNIQGHNQYYGRDITDLLWTCVTPAHELGCKMASADRVAQQLQISSHAVNNSLTCMDMNKIAYNTAIDYLKSTEAGKKTLDRFEERGRPICFTPDFDPPDHIGPLWESNRMRIKDDDQNKCLEVASLKEGPEPLDGLVFPGIHYCKLLSPARVIDYMMTDSLKAVSGCLNKDSIQETHIFL